MSAEGLEALAESARNRGLKLVRSRVRTPGKAGFGKVGVVDAGGAAVFGIDSGSPSANPGAVEQYLRGLGASDWRASIGSEALGKPKRRTPRTEEPEPGPAAAPAPEPQIAIRSAEEPDAEALTALIGILDYAVDAPGIAERLALLTAAGEPPLVATLDDNVVGLCGLHVMTVIHRAQPVGRITILAVAQAARGRGLGRQLVAAAEQRLAQAGCTLLEITSNDRLTQAHAFYRHLGFERTSMRFARPIGPAATL